MTIALYHFHVTQIKRSAGQSAVAAAAYRSGEKLHSEYYGEDSDYTRKGGVICSEILLPPQAPPSFSNRETLWNAVEKVERGKKAQLASSFDIALQNEFSMQENIDLARQFLLEQFVSRGMTVDFAVHQPDKEDGGIQNPHFHVMCPIRPIEPDGRWGNKQRREYVLDEHGNRIRNEAGNDVFNAVPTTDWGSPETLESWRQAWAELSKPQPPTLVELLSAYYDNRNKGAYSSKARIANLKKLSEAVSYLEAKHLYTADDLDAALHTMQGKVDTLKKLASGKQARIKELDELLRMADYYKAGKPVADKLKTIRFEKSRQKYKADHDEELRLFYMAERKLKGKIENGKLPAAAWRAEKARLETAYRDLQQELTPLYADTKKLWAIHYSIYEVQHEQERQNAVTWQKKQEIEH